MGNLPKQPVFHWNLHGIGFSHCETKPNSSIYHISVVVYPLLSRDIPKYTQPLDSHLPPTTRTNPDSPPREGNKRAKNTKTEKKQQILVNPLSLVNMSLFLYIIKTPGENVNLPSKIQEVPWKYELTGGTHFLMRTWTPQNWHVKEQLWWNKKTGHKQQKFEKQIWIQCNKSSCGWKITRMNPSDWHSERHVGWSTEQPL